MTYNCCNCDYLTPVLIRDPQMIDCETAKAPMVVVGCLLSTGKSTADYEFLARNLVKKAEFEQTDVILRPG